MEIGKRLGYNGAIQRKTGVQAPFTGISAPDPGEDPQTGKFLWRKFRSGDRAPVFSGAETGLPGGKPGYPEAAGQKNSTEYEYPVEKRKQGTPHVRCITLCIM